MKILAIDLGKAKSTFCWFDSSDQSHAFKTVASTPQAFGDALVERPVELVVIEACDMAGWVQELCTKLGLTIEVVNANSDGWRWKHVKNKTDRRDALKMAQLRAAGPLKTVCVPPRPQRKYKSLILYRHRLVERRTRVKNSIHALLASEGRAVMGPGLWEPQSLARIRQLATAIDACASKDQLWSGHLQMELDQLDFMEQQIGKLDAKLDSLGDTDPAVIRLRTIPGVGPRLAELVVAVLGDVHRFKSVREVSAYAGLVPRRYQSGEMDRHGRITKAGCGKLRKVLVQVAWGMLRHNARGQAVFNGISKGHKTRRKQAAVALARRVLCWCWAMLRDGTDWREGDATATGRSAMTVEATKKPGRDESHRAARTMTQSGRAAAPRGARPAKQRPDREAALPS
jgi:transposase